MNGKKHRIIIVILLIVVLAALAVGGLAVAKRLRSSHYEGASIATELDLIDTYIQQGDMVQALESLEKIENRALAMYDRIGIYKRYMVLGEQKKAEQSLVRSMKKFPDSKEILAIYGNLLLRQDRVREAVKKTAKLSGSDYGSVYAEAFMRYAASSEWDADSLFASKKLFKKKQKKRSPEGEESPSLFLDRRFIPIYTDAFKGSGITKWVVNAAALLMEDGRYADAAALCPQDADTFRDALFWGLVYYDSGNYAESLAMLLKADSLDASNDIRSAIELRALESDAYYVLGDDASAQAMREKILDSSSPYMDAFIQDKTPDLGRVLPLLFMNTALYARDSGDPAAQYEKLYELINYYPTYEPGLAAYGEYAIESQRRPEEDSLARSLRSAGLRSMGMEARDAVPVVAFSDVIARSDAALAEESNPSLVVLKEIMRAEPERGEEKTLKASRVWKLLEENEMGPSLYPAEVLHYAIVTLIANDDVPSARKLFRSAVLASYGKEGEEADDVLADPQRLNLWECEVAAYLAAYDKRYPVAQELYSHILEKYTARSPMLNTAGQNDAVTGAYVNLANVHAGYNRHADALELLNRASSRATEVRLRAEILYRIAAECHAAGNSKDAVRSLQYALSLNPSHNRARLLLKRIQDGK